MYRLQQRLRKIDGKGYKAYKELQGRYSGPWFDLHIDYVQGDPFASPSRIRVSIARKRTRIDREWFASSHRCIALEDCLAREMAQAIRRRGRKVNGTGASGLIHVDEPGQEMLKRTAVKVDEEKVEVRLSVGLPAAGRRILGKQAITMLCEEVPQLVERAIFSFDESRLQKQLQLADQQEAIRTKMRENGWIAFVANGSILPRQSGVSSRPLTQGKVIPFKSPVELEVEIPLPHRDPIRGMAIPAGVTLIVGGGYHGKSTLLQAIEQGVYPHIAGDGREYVLTDESACKIRAEDGRSVSKVNISPFISNLPFDKDTSQFRTEDASGSTSQATNIMEALEMDSRLILMDEDTSATNFMIRDIRMQRLVHKQQEPITPFIDKVRSLYEEYGVSTILVIGGSGDYLEVADTVIKMESYQPKDVTELAKQIAREYDTGRQIEGGDRFGEITPRVIQPQSFDARKGRREKIKTRGLEQILYGKHEIDLVSIEQLVDPSQTRAIADMIRYLAQNHFDGHTSLKEAINRLYQQVEEQGLDIVSPYCGQHPGDLALPRPWELAAAINRLRSLQVK